MIYPAKQSNNKIRKRGFTLVELIVVIVIVGILASIAVPMINSNIKRAQGTEALAILGTMRTAERLYFMEHGVYTSNLTALDSSWITISNLEGRYYGQSCLYAILPNRFILKIIGRAGTASEGEWIEMDCDGSVRKSYEYDNSFLWYN